MPTGVDREEEFHVPLILMLGDEKQSSWITEDVHRQQLL